MRESLEVGLTLQLWSLSSSGGSFGLPLGSVVEDVQAPAAGRYDIGDKFGAFSADVSERAAMCVQVGELLLHRAAGQSAQGPAEGQGGIIVIFRVKYRVNTQADAATSLLFFLTDISI